MVPLTAITRKEGQVWPLQYFTAKLLRRPGPKKYAFIGISSRGDIIKSNQALYTVAKEDNKKKGKKSENDE